METRNGLSCPPASNIGPYKATKLWNDTINAFRQGVPRGKQRRFMRTAEDCFLGSTAVDWLWDHLRKQKEFGSDVTRQQTTNLLNKFYKAGIFEEIQISRRGRNKTDFSDSNRLYRLRPFSPSKGTRVPLADRTTNTLPLSRPPLFPTAKSHQGRRSQDDRGGKTGGGAPVRSGEKTGDDGDDLTIDRLPQCHLVGRFLTGPQIHEIWKTAALSRLKKVLDLESLDDILQDYAVSGGHVRHNCIFLNKSGIVTNIQPQDQLPHWVLSAMKCLARWPERVEGDLPSYPGFERDVFGVVRDYFLGLEEPLITHDLYDVIINVFVQACHHLPRHSSPFSRDEKRFCYSLFSDSSLENVIMNLTRKYCLTDSKGDIHSLTDSRADIHSLAHSRPDLSGGALTQGGSQALSHCDWFSGAHSLAQSRTSLARSRTGLAQSQTNLGQSQTNLDQSRTGLAQSQTNLGQSQTNLGQSQTGLAQSQTGLAQNEGSGGRPLKGSQRAVHGVGQGESDPQPGAGSSQCSTLPRRQARSRSHLPGHSGPCSQGDLRGVGASSQGDLRGVGACPGDLRGMGASSQGDLRGGVSASSLCASGGWQHAAAPTRTASQAALGRCSDPSNLRDSRQFRSNPDLQVSRYETAFGPDDQTVTRVYYCNGMATDFHHSAAEENDLLSPVETHFDGVTDSAAAKRQSSRISCERVNGSSSFATNKSVNLTRGSESLRNSAGRSRSYNSFQRQQQQRSSGYDSSAFASSSEHQDSGLDDRKLSSPLWDTQGKPPPYQRSRGERYKTFSGSQFGVDQPGEGEGGGLEEEDRRLSVSTPYLPGLRLGGGGGDPGEGGAPPLRPSSRSQGLSSGSAARRCSSLYLNVPQSGLQEERTVKALQLVCLFLPPASRRKLHFLLKLMSKMAANPFLTFDPSQTTRSLVLGTFQQAVLRGAGEGGEGELDAVLVFQLVSFLVDHHMDVMAVPTDLKQAVEGRLTALEKPQIVYSPRDPGTLRFAQPVSTEQYEASKRSHSHNALVALLDAMVRDGSVVPRERRRRLKQFQKTYPQIYRQRFPDATSDPLNCDPSLQGRPPLLSRPLNKLRGLRV